LWVWPQHPQGLPAPTGKPCTDLPTHAIQPSCHRLSALASLYPQICPTGSPGSICSKVVPCIPTISHLIPDGWRGWVSKNNKLKTPIHLYHFNCHTPSFCPWLYPTNSGQVQRPPTPDARFPRRDSTSGPKHTQVPPNFPPGFRGPGDIVTSSMSSHSIGMPAKNRSAGRVHGSLSAVSSYRFGQKKNGSELSPMSLPDLAGKSLGPASCYPLLIGVCHRGRLHEKPMDLP
jgi:hypothetical protein